MAKKQETKKVEVEEPQVKEETIVETPVVETVKVEKPKRTGPVYKKAEDGWEIRDRMYRLKGDKKPLSRMLKSANVYYFDEEAREKEDASLLQRLMIC